MKLDLGCGAAKTEGALGADLVALPGVDVVVDLRQRPYPFATGAFTAIHLNDVIEHIPDTVRTMEELWRLLRPDGRVHIRVVNWNSHYTAMDPTHLHAYTEESFDFFGKRSNRSYYSRARFDVVRVERRFSDVARHFCPSERLLYFFSRFLSNVLEDLTFELRAVKPASEPGEPQPGDWRGLLRCPYALARGQGGALRRNGDWLISDESGHRYPVRGGVPVMTIEEGARWAAGAECDLPPPGALDPLPPPEDPLSSQTVAVPTIAPITTPVELVKELVATYVPMAGRVVADAVRRRLGRSPRT